MGQTIENLDGEDSALLNKKGWFLVTFYQCRKDDACISLDLAHTKANSIPRPTGIRTIEKDRYIVFEVWDYWK